MMLLGQPHDRGIGLAPEWCSSHSMRRRQRHAIHPANNNNGNAIAPTRAA
jgi:hypothetical protein